MGDVEPQDIKALRAELSKITNQVHTAMTEIAFIRHPAMPQDRVQSAVDELAAIVASTEEATDQILETAEKLEYAIERISVKCGNSEIEDLNSSVTNIYEACNFQDITGQRISKVIALLRDVDTRLMAMIEALGEERFNDMPPPANVSADQALLNGPALGDGMRQDLIDSLFD